MSQSYGVLLYGKDGLLLDLRAKVLSASGFVSQATEDPAAALNLIRGGRFDLLILCQTLSDSDCIVALEIAAAWQPRMKRLVLTHGARNLPDDMFDAECNPASGPECLLRQTLMLLNTSATGLDQQT
jgi:DNA-binding NtrC family response regulator